MNKKGFTLIELLAVIVVLAIIGTIAGSKMIELKKKTAEEEIEKIKEDIKALGPDVYLELQNMDENKKNEYQNSCKEQEDDKWCFSIEQLNALNYLKSSSIKSPYDNSSCSGGLIISKNGSDVYFSEDIVCNDMKQEDQDEENENYDELEDYEDENYDELEDYEENEEEF